MEYTSKTVSIFHGTKSGASYSWYSPGCQQRKADKSYLMDSRIIFKMARVGKWCNWLNVISIICWHNSDIHICTIYKDIYTLWFAAADLFWYSFFWLSDIDHIYPYLPGLLNYHCDADTIAKSPGKQPWRICVNIWQVSDDWWVKHNLSCTSNNV